MTLNSLRPGRFGSGRLLWLCAFITLLSLQAAPTSAHPPGVTDEDQAVAHEVEAFREFIKRAIEKRDARALRKLYADSFTHTHSSGWIESKDARIASLLAGEAMLERAPAEEVLYRVFAGHTIIVTGKSPIFSKAERRTNQLRWIAVYVKVGSDWKLAASQATRVP